MNNFELEHLVDEAVRREFRRVMSEVLNGMLGVDAAAVKCTDAIYNMMDEIFNEPIGGHGAYSPYDEPLVKTITLSDSIKNDTERAVRRVLMEWSGLA